MIELLKKVKRALSAWVLKAKVRREANIAFRYDRAQFMANAGALHLDRKAAACAEIVMGYHVIEKGLTMPRRRLGFGKGAVVHLVNLISSFEKRFGRDDPQVRHAVGVLRAYRELHRESPDAMPRLDAFLAAHSDIPAADEPHVTRGEFFAAKDAPFPRFAASRHVCRHFAGPVLRETIESAVELALTAPSACNRQHARVHAVDDPALRDRLFAMQRGTRGFGADADKVLVVTADLSSVRWAWERHDAYVNGGIFVMNLCYALHIAFLSRKRCPRLIFLLDSVIAHKVVGEFSVGTVNHHAHFSGVDEEHLARILFLAIEEPDADRNRDIIE